MESKQKRTWGGIMLIRTFVLKVINNKRRKLTHHKIINRIAEQIVLVITQVSKQSKLWVHPNLRRPSFLFTYSFKFTYFCIVYIYIYKPEKRNFVKENKKLFKAIKSKTKHKILSQIYIIGKL